MKKLNSLVNLGGLELKTRALGPGYRSIIWAQGCIFNCKGCINPHFKPTHDHLLIRVDDLYKKIVGNEIIEGVTITGGEPFLQPKGLGALASAIKEKSLSVQVYTGFKLDELINSKNKYVYKFLDSIDVLIDGKFEDDKKISTGYKGSSNQNIYFFTSRYSIVDYEKENLFEIGITKNKMNIVGFYE